MSERLLLEAIFTATAEVTHAPTSTTDDAACGDDKE